MDSVDLQVLKSSVAWRKQGHKVVLVTIVETWGSSPRPVGAMLAVRDDGLVSGSVSGGCVEDDLIYKIRDESLAVDRPQVVTYGITKEEAERFGLPCGGTLQLVLETVEDDVALGELLERVERHELVSRTLDMGTGRPCLDRHRETMSCPSMERHLGAYMVRGGVCLLLAPGSCPVMWRRWRRRSTITSLCVTHAKNMRKRGM